MVPVDPMIGFSGTFVTDLLSSVLKVSMLLIGYYAIFYARTYLNVHGESRGEYYVLALFSLLGMMVLVSANSMLTVYLGLNDVPVPAIYGPSADEGS